MTILVLVAHAPLASAFRGTGGHCFAEQAQRVRALDVLPDATPASVAHELTQLLADLPPQMPVLFLADTLGATPCKGVQAYSQTRAHTRLVAGLNLPMLWRTLCYLEKPFETLPAIAAEGGLEGIRRSIEP
jgi:mannose PTS system EIIA component